MIKNKKMLLLVLALGTASLFLGGCTQEKIDEKPNGVIFEEQETLKAYKFIPNGAYEVEFENSDLAFDVCFVKGDGSNYQRLGTTGRGTYVEVFTNKENNLVRTYTEHLDDVVLSDDLYTFNYFGENNIEDELYLPTSLEKSSKFNNMKVIDVGKNLKLKNIELNGSYVVIEDDKSTDEMNIIETTYYSEGLGIVKHEVKTDDNIVEYSELKSYKKV